MKITIKPKDCGKRNYSNTFRCPIACALKRKFILPNVGPDCYNGLFLGFIPVWGSISPILEHRSYELSLTDITVNETYEIGLYK